MCVWVFCLLVCMYVYRIHACCLQSPEVGIKSLGSEVTGVSHHVVLGTKLRFLTSALDSAISPAPSH